LITIQQNTSKGIIGAIPDATTTILLLADRPSASNKLLLQNPGNKALFVYVYPRSAADPVMGNTGAQGQGWLVLSNASLVVDIGFSEVTQFDVSIYPEAGSGGNQSLLTTWCQVAQDGV
jgi:hypothetical protein